MHFVVWYVYNSSTTVVLVLSLCSWERPCGIHVELLVWYSPVCTCDVYFFRLVCRRSFCGRDISSVLSLLLGEHFSSVAFFFFVRCFCPLCWWGAVPAICTKGLACRAIIGAGGGLLLSAHGGSVGEGKVSGCAAVWGHGHCILMGTKSVEKTFIVYGATGKHLAQEISAREMSKTEHPVCRNCAVVDGCATYTCRVMVGLHVWVFYGVSRGHPGVFSESVA